MRWTILFVSAGLTVGGFVTVGEAAVDTGAVHVRAPNVLHMTPEHAYAVARRNGFRVAIPKAFRSSSEATPRVLRQWPGPRRRARRGSVLTLTMGIGGLGSPANTVPLRQGTVPWVVGLSVPEATRRIDAQYLRLEVRYSALRPTRKARFQDNYSVVAQNPAPGTQWDDQHPPVQVHAG